MLATGLGLDVRKIRSEADLFIDHALELRAAVIGGRCAGFDEGFDQLQVAGLAIGFALPLLIGDSNVMLGLPRRRDAQVKGGT